MKYEIYDGGSKEAVVEFKLVKDNNVIKLMARNPGDDFWFYATVDWRLLFMIARVESCQKEESLSNEKDN